MTENCITPQRKGGRVCQRGSVDLRTHGAGQTEKWGHECVFRKEGSDEMKSGWKEGRERKRGGDSDWKRRVRQREYHKF